MVEHPTISRLASHEDTKRGALADPSVIVVGDASKAISHGLTFRPLAVTAKDTLDWHKTRPDAERMKTLNGEINGIGMKREAEVLAAWKASRKQ